MSESILPNGNERQCYWCELPFNLERHHIFHGTANRRLAEEDGCWCYLCRKCHTGTYGVHRSSYMDITLKMKAQAAWEAKYGNREDFRRRYGKSYL